MFKKIGIDIDDLAIDLDVAVHQTIHGGADWRLARCVWSNEWNPRIL